MSLDRRRLGIGLSLVAGVLTAAGANALRQVFDEISDPGRGSLMLGVLQFATATSALVAAIAIIRRDTRAPYVIAAWGVISAALVVLLEPLGVVAAGDRLGLWQGAAVILVLAAAMYWYVRQNLVAT